MIASSLAAAPPARARPKPSDFMNEGDGSALEAPRALLRARKLGEAEAALLRVLKSESPKGVKASACVYLGYIRDNRHDRAGAIRYFRMAKDFGDESGLAESGLGGPLLWLRHINRGPPARAPARVPSLALTNAQMRQDVEFACREIPKYYQALEDKNIPWGKICKSYQAEAEGVSRVEDFYRLMFRLAAELQDSHTRFSNFPYAYLGYGAGAACRCGAGGRKAWIAAVREGSPAERSGLKAGDEILSVDGSSVTDRVNAVSRELSGASTERLRLLEACRMLLQADRGEDLALRFGDLGGGKPAEAVIARERGLPPRIPPPPPPAGAVTGKSLMYARLPGNLGYIRFKDFEDQTGASLREYRRTLARLDGAAGIVFDVRGNPGGFGDVPRGIIRTLLKKRTVVGVNKARRPDGRWETKTETLDPDPHAKVEVPAVLLTDETTQSAAELFAAMAAYAGIPRVGAPTGGMLGGWSYDLDFPSGLRLAVQYGSALLQDGRAVEGRGVWPDVPVEVSRQDEAAGRDPALEAAAILLTRP